MGPTNIALVTLNNAEQTLREAQGRLDTATRDVRIQERKVKDLTEKLQVAQTQLREQQSQAAQLDLDMKTRDAHIEKLRNQQQSAKTNKEYQTFLIEINTEKVDRNKVEDQLLKGMESVEATQEQIKELTTFLENEKTKLADARAKIGDRLTVLQAEIDRLTPLRDQAATAVPAKALHAFQRLADRFDGEAMASIGKPDRRREEYICNACNMNIVADIYNRLHVRDELIFCPSCHRILYIPDDLPPELAINTRGKSSRNDKDESESKTEE